MTFSQEIPDEGKALETKIGRYSREHPHYVRSYILDITFSLVAGVLLFYFIGGTQMDDADRLSRISGAVTLSESQLTQAVKSSGALAYWLGPISGSKYTLVISKEGQAIITYLPNGEGLEKQGERRLIVTTDVSSNSVGPLESQASQVKSLDLTAQGEATYSFDSYLPDHVVITLPNSAGHVRIYYPTTRTAGNILLDAQSLIRIP